MTAETSPDGAVDWLAILLNSEPFIHLSPVNLQKLFACMEDVELQAGEFVFNQGDAGDAYYIIKQGECEVLRQMTNGKNIKLAGLRLGDKFGGDAIISQQTRSASVRMVTDGALVKVERDKFLELMVDPLIKNVDLPQADLLHAGGAVWLDVREPEELQQTGALPDCLNIPLNLLRVQSTKLEPAKTYLVYCDNGQRSKTAAFVLAERGISVHYVAGGCASRLSPVPGISAVPVAAVTEYVPTPVAVPPPVTEAVALPVVPPPASTPVGADPVAAESPENKPADIRRLMGTVAKMKQEYGNLLDRTKKAAVQQIHKQQQQYKTLLEEKNQELQQAKEAAQQAEAELNTLRDTGVSRSQLAQIDRLPVDAAAELPAAALQMRSQLLEFRYMIKSLMQRNAELATQLKQERDLTEQQRRETAQLQREKLNEVQGRYEKLRKQDSETMHNERQVLTAERENLRQALDESLSAQNQAENASLTLVEINNGLQAELATAQQEVEMYKSISLQNLPDLLAPVPVLTEAVAAEEDGAAAEDGEILL